MTLASMKYYKDPEDAWNQMCLEARVMEFLSGLPSFPDVYGVFREGNECRMVQEFVGDNQTHTSITLLNVMKTGRPTITGLECITMTSEVAKGLHEMHTRGLLHNDVAARNILICHNGIRFTAKLTDFGMVSSIQKPRRSKKMSFKSEAEKDLYISKHPETPIEKIVYGASDSVQTDIFSLGYGIKVLGTAIGNIHMSAVGDACIRVNAGERPPLDYVISTLDLVADCERVTPVCQSIDRPLF
ncbi:tyrosine-protein kinase SRK2-like [Anneissia japonica]|uniref:tyrosine-protein kinase SRK2-like n=1 Tax=Anneissia japonica TaxID=1529436 RepID=UPI00142561C2|nr:tyrosine-protein kinase SRK2-like [Anneissia japonica]